MHESSPMLKASKRERIGTRYAQRERAAGKLPAILFGHGRPPEPISVDAKEALSHITKGEKIFRLDFPGTDNADEGQVVLLKDLQFDYLGTNIVHADFARVDLNERVHSRVSIRLVGEPIGLKTAGAVLFHPVTEVDIECRVVDLPDFIEVSVLNLGVDQAVYAREVKLPRDDMKLLSDPNAILAQVQVQKALESGEAATVGAEGAQPEVITAKKPAEGDAKAGAKPAGDKKK